MVRMKAKDKERVRKLLAIYFRAKKEGNKKLALGVLSHVMHVTNYANEENRVYRKTRRKENY